MKGSIAESEETNLHWDAHKHISRRTGISFNTIKRWYNGHNLPVSQHLLVLTPHYNCALRAFLEASGIRVVVNLNLGKGKNMAHNSTAKISLTPAEAKALNR